MVPQSARKTSSASASAASPVLVWNQLSLDVLSRSADVKVCGWRPHDGGAAHTGAGVRKPPREETAGGVERPARQTLSGFRRRRFLVEVRRPPLWDTIARGTNPARRMG